MKKGPFWWKKLREIKSIFKNRGRIPKEQFREQILMTGNGCCCQFRGVEGTQVAASVKKELEVFPPLASDKTRSSSNQFLSLETSSMDAHELTSLLATQPEGQYLVPPLLSSRLPLLLAQPLQWQPEPRPEKPPNPCETEPRARGAENTNSESKQKINSALSDDSHLSTLICGWPYMSLNVDLFTVGIFKVRFVYSCSDSSYSYANNKP